MNRKTWFGGFGWACVFVSYVSFCNPFFELMSRKAEKSSMKRKADYMFVCVCVCVCMCVYSVVFVKVSCWYERTGNIYVVN